MLLQNLTEEELFDRMMDFVTKKKIVACIYNNSTGEIVTADDVRMTRNYIQECAKTTDNFDMYFFSVDKACVEWMKQYNRKCRKHERTKQLCSSDEKLVECWECGAYIVVSKNETDEGWECQKCVEFWESCRELEDVELEIDEEVLAKIMSDDDDSYQLDDDEDWY